MTIEEKAKAYDEAIARAKALYDNNQPISSNNVIINNIFPGLVESNDEKIRKSLLNYLHTLPNHFSHKGGLVTDWLAWLEKQGEQKVWTDNDYDRVKSIEYLLHELDNHNFDDWFNSLKKDNI